MSYKMQYHLNQIFQSGLHTISKPSYSSHTNEYLRFGNIIENII